MKKKVDVVEVAEVTETEVSEAVAAEISKLEAEKEQLTTVKVKLTDIKYYSETDSIVVDFQQVGKLTVSDCQKLVKSFDEKNVFISRKLSVDEFQVNTDSLIALKGSV